MLKISIITVCYNSENTINDCIDSVIAQTYENIEYIIIDGASRDKTVERVREYKEGVSRFISEKDRGIYDAMNKGLAMATGDVIGFLNSDDFFSSADVISRVAEAFASTELPVVFGDLVFVDSLDLKKVARYYSVPGFKPWWLRFGIMPPHTATFLRREIFEKYGNFQIDYRIAADYEHFVRIFWKHGVQYQHIPLLVTRMRSGGVSSRGFYSKYILNREIIRGCLANGLYTNFFLLLLKLPYRLFELIKKPALELK